MNQAQSTHEANHFYVLAGCMLGSLALLVAGAWLAWPPTVVMAGALVPLVGYHLYYLAPRARRGLSQTAIDSVYYYGFLVTIAALAVSAIQLATGEKMDSLAAVGAQFGLGLAATGYAVLARMHLTSIGTSETTTPEEQLEKVFRSTGQFTANIELASAQFAGLTQALAETTQATTTKILAAADESMTAVARRFDQQLSEVLAASLQGINEMKTLMVESTFAQERKQLLEGMATTLNTVANLNKAMEEMAQRSVQSAGSISALNTANEQLEDAIQRLERRLSTVAGDQGAAAATARTLESISQLSQRSSELMQATVRSLEDLQPSVPAAVVTLKSIRQLSARANDQMEALAESSARLANATANVGQGADAVSAFATTLERIGSMAPEADKGLRDFGQAVTTFRVTLGQSTSDLRSVAHDAVQAVKQGTEESSKAVGVFVNGLSRATQALVERARSEVPA